MIRNKRDFILGLVMTAFGLFLVFSQEIVVGFSLFQTPIWLAKADTYLRILGALLALVSLIVAVRACLPGFAEKEEGEKGGKKRRFDWVVAASFAAFLPYLLLLEVIGFVPDTIWLTTFITFLIRARETQLDWHDSRALWKCVGISALYAVLLVLALTFVFVKWLKVRLP